MSATGRETLAPVEALDPTDLGGPDTKAAKAFRAEVEALASSTGWPEQAVRDILATARRRRVKTKRAKGDFYETPSWAVDAIVPHLPLDGEPIIVDAGAGTGAISARLADVNPKAEIVGIEKNVELVVKARARGLRNAEFVTADFEAWAPEVGAPDLVIMNPPFARALEFVRRALEIIKRGGTVVALLRLGWLESRARVDFLKKHTPDVFVLARRPSFTGRGTDATAYAWMKWGPTTTGRVEFLAHDGKARRKHAARKTLSSAKA